MSEGKLGEGGDYTNDQKVRRRKGERYE